MAAVAVVDPWTPSVTGWRLTYPAAYIENQVTLPDADVMAVWGLSRYTVVATALDMYTDSNTRQRSVICSEALLINMWVVEQDR